MWAVLGADLFLCFVTSSSPLFLLKISRSWAHCASAVPSGHSHLPVCSQILSVTIVGSKTFWKSWWKVLSLSCGAGQRNLSPTAHLGKDVGFLDARVFLLLSGAHRLLGCLDALPWGQRYAVKSAPHILDSLPYALGPGFPLADQGWEGWWGIHWAVSWFEIANTDYCSTLSARYPEPYNLTHLSYITVSSRSQHPFPFVRTGTIGFMTTERATGFGACACSLPAYMLLCVCSPVSQPLLIPSSFSLGHRFVMVPGGCVCELGCSCGHSRMLPKLFGCQYPLLHFQ